MSEWLTSEGRDRQQECASQRLVVLLGASNLTYSLPVVLRHVVHRLSGRDATVLVAHGPGRSYGVDAGVLGVRFLGISACGLFRALEKERARTDDVETFALLTDIGNDILYQSGVDQTLGWIQRVTDRLLDFGAKVGITSLPVASVEDMPAWKFRTLRPLFYPFRPMPQQDVRLQVREIQAGLEEIGRTRDVRILPSRREWYGFDHFHLRKRCRREAFSFWIDQVLDAKDVPPDADVAGRLQISSTRCTFHRPAEYIWLGRRRRHDQNGLTISPTVRYVCF